VADLHLATARVVTDQNLRILLVTRTIPALTCRASDGKAIPAATNVSAPYWHCQFGNIQGLHARNVALDGGIVVLDATGKPILEPATPPHGDERLAVPSVLTRRGPLCNTPSRPFNYPHTALPKRSKCNLQTTILPKTGSSVAATGVHAPDHYPTGDISGIFSRPKPN
jgi:hypothetical protein